MKKNYDFPGCCRQCGYVKKSLDSEGFCQRCREEDAAWQTIFALSEDEFEVALGEAARREVDEDVYAYRYPPRRGRLGPPSDPEL